MLQQIVSHVCPCHLLSRRSWRRTKLRKVTVDLTAVTTEQLQSAYKDFPVMQQVLKHLRNSWPRAVKSLDPALQPFDRILAELDGVLLRGPHRLVIPLALQPRTKV